MAGLGSASWAQISPSSKGRTPRVPLQAAVGDLNRIKRIVKLMVLVNSTPTFTEQHLVANGASELFVEIFGDAGMHARSAFGVAQVPFGSCVEIDLVAEVDE
jgi:enamine deaminase RidA (YjgF/YER057c/UK114 family)